MVELAAVEVESAHQSTHAAVYGTDSDERRFGFRQLQDLPTIFFVLLNADQGPAPDLLVRRGLVIEHLLREFEALAGYGHHLPAAAVGAHLPRAGLQHHRDEEVVVVGLLRQRLFDGVVRLALRGQFDVALRAAVAMAPVVVQHAAAQRGVGRLLVGFGYGGVNAVTFGIDVVGEALVQHLPHHFRDVLGAHGIFVGLVLDHKLHLLCFGKLGVGEVAQFVHAPQHV